MLIKTFGSAVYGVEATTITIEVNWIHNQGKDPMIVGLPDNAVKESLQRIESTFKTNGGTMAEANAVAYLFDKKGLILVEGDNITEDDVMEIALDAGAEDIEKDDEKVFAVKTAVNDFHAVLAVMEPKLTAKGYKIVESGLKYIPQTTIAVDGEKGKEALELISALEDNDDVQNVYSNLELTESLMA